MTKSRNIVENLRVRYRPRLIKVKLPLEALEGEGSSDGNDAAASRTWILLHHADTIDLRDELSAQVGENSVDRPFPLKYFQRRLDLYQPRPVSDP